MDTKTHTHINNLNLLILDLLKTVTDLNDNKQMFFAFECYSAILLTEKTNKPFYIYSKLTPKQKEILYENGYPTIDIGADGVNLDVFDFFQSKLYNENKYINRTDIANFVTYKLYGKNRSNKSNLYLFRTDNSKINKDSKILFDNNHIIDSPINKQDFLSYIQYLINNRNMIENMETELELNFERDYQYHSRLLLHQNNKLILNIPTGCGKTYISLEYIKDMIQNNAFSKFLVLVPTLILLEQWYTESSNYSNNVVLIGSGYKNSITLKDIKENNIFICVYNSVEHILPFINFFTKIFVNEAHRIFKPRIYQEIADDLENDEEEVNHDLDAAITLESRNNVKYTDIITNIIHNDRTNVALLSATIDSHDNFMYYSYSIREAIDNNYLTDYQIICPIFNNDPTDRNIAEYLVNKNELHCIIFAKNRSEGINFCHNLNEIIPYSAEYIDCFTSKTDRKNIISNFNSGTIRFLVNVRILFEGFNSKICSSVLFLHLPSSDTFIIQTIGRILRLDKTKPISNIYLPFNTEKDAKDIGNFIRNICSNDSKIMKNYQEKKEGIYLNFEKIKKKNSKINENEVNKNIDENELDIEYKYDLILKNITIQKITPKEKAILLLEFVEKNNRVPRANEVYENNSIIIKIGQFWTNIKSGQHKIIYETILCKNDILKADYNKTKQKITPKEKANLLLKFVEINKRVPKRNETFEENGIIIKIGQFFHDIKQGKNKTIYETILSKNDILRIDYEKTEKVREEKGREKREEKITPKEKANLLLKFVKINKRVPKKRELFEKDGIIIKIGRFWTSIKSGQHKIIYETILSKNNILRIDYNNLQEKRKERKEDNEEE